MRQCAKVGKHGEVIIPELIRTRLALITGSEIEFSLDGSVATIASTAAHRPAMSAAEIATYVSNFEGIVPGGIQALGFTSVDAYLKATRGR